MRGKANVTVCAAFCFSQLGSPVGCLKIFASGRFRRSYATGIVSFIRARKTERYSQRLSIDSYYAGYGFKNLRRKDDRRSFCYVTTTDNVLFKLVTVQRLLKLLITEKHANRKKNALLTIGCWLLSLLL